MGEETVLLSLVGGVAEVVLNRPDKLNAVNSTLAHDLRRRLEAAEQAGVRALLMRGQGRGFCAGRDLADAEPLTEDGEAVLMNELNPLVQLVADFPAPTFAAVHGAALGTGLGLALACDVVYAAHSAKIGSPFARIGAVLDSGAHEHFVRRAGPHRALELVYTGRLLSGTEAAEWGIVNAAVADDELLDTVRAMATAAAQGPTAAFLASKRIVRAMGEEGLGFSAVLAAEAVAQGAASRTHDYREGITAFQEKRSPTFLGS